MKAEKHAVRQLAELQDSGADTAGALISAGGADLFQIRRALFNGYIAAASVRRVKKRLQRSLHIFQAHIEIGENSLMAKAPQRSADRRGADQRDMPLGADAAAQNNG